MHWVYATGYPRGNKVAVNLDAVQVIQIQKAPMQGGLIGQMIDVSEIYLGGLTTIPTGQDAHGNPTYQITFATTVVKETVEQLLALPRIRMGDAEVKKLALVPGPFAPVAGAAAVTAPDPRPATGPSEGQGGVGGPSATDTA